MTYTPTHIIASFTLIFTGKPKNPHYFRGTDIPTTLIKKNQPFVYKFNKKAWMLSGIFKEWAVSVNEIMKKEVIDSEEYSTR